MTLNPLAPTSVLSSTRLLELGPGLGCGSHLCICFLQVLGEGSLMTVTVVTNLIAGESQF